MKNTQKGFIVPLLIIIIAALTIGGGFYIHSQNRKIAEQAPPKTNNSLKNDASTASPKDHYTPTSTNSSVSKVTASSSSSVKTSVSTNIQLKHFKSVDLQFDYPSNATTTTIIVAKKAHPIDYLVSTSTETSWRESVKQPLAPFFKVFYIGEEKDNNTINFSQGLDYSWATGSIPSCTQVQYTQCKKIMAGEEALVVWTSSTDARVVALFNTIVASLKYTNYIEF